MKDFKDNFVDFMDNYRNDLIVVIVSMILIIIGMLTIGLPALVIVIILDIIYFVPFFRNKVIDLYYKITKKDHYVPQHKSGSHSKNYKVSNYSKNTSSKKGKNSKKKKKAGYIALIIIGIILVIFILGFLFIALTAPKFDPKKLYASEPSIVYDKEGKEIARLGSEQRELIEYDQMPEVLIDAIISTEDSKFFSHGGVDWARFIKASLLQLVGRSDAGGASTLTMQVSKNTYTSTEASGIKGIIRKFTDIYISEFKIEPNYSKEEIMEFYVNSYYLGNNSYGVAQAAKTYFNKNVSDLNISEAAMIAGLFQAPSKYNPYRNPKATEARRLLVLKLMKRHGYINNKEYEAAKKMTVDKIVKGAENTSAGNISEYQSFLDVVVDEIKKETGNDPYTVPMKIYSTMNTEKQKYVNDVMNGVTFDWENDEVQAGVAVVDINDGSIAAIGGGRNVNAAATLNRATQIKRQIGSTAKPPYDYGPAIEYMNWSTGQGDPDEPISYSDGTPINNWDGGFESWETIRLALAHSRNIPALKAFQANDKAKITSFVKSLGLSPESNLHEAHSIGGYTGENPLSMAAAYAAFGNGGYYTKPYSYTKIYYQVEKEEVDNKKIESKKQVMKDSTAYMITSMLIDTGQFGLYGYRNINGKQFAAKTGTTNFDEATMKALGLRDGVVNDLWTIGYNPEYAIGVWYGYDKNNSKHHNRLGTGEHERLFQKLGKGMFTSDKTFKQPSSVVSVAIENENPYPMLPSEYTPAGLIITELFVKGSEPTEVSKRFSKLSATESLNATSDANGKVKISWKEVPVQEVNTVAYLDDFFKNTWKNPGLRSSFINSRIAYLGAYGYQVTITGPGYNKTEFTSGTSFEFNAPTSGTYTISIKTIYANFPATASDGKTTTVSASGQKEDTKNPTCSLSYTLTPDKTKCCLSTGTEPKDCVTPTCDSGYTFTIVDGKGVCKK